jgi:hypothetical protein
MVGHRTQLNATIHDRTITHVTITDPQHCLFGKRLAVIRERSGRGCRGAGVEPLGAGLVMGAVGHRLDYDDDDSLETLEHGEQRWRRR